MRFTIRDLLWLTLLTAVLVTWWIDRGRLLEKAENGKLWLEFYDQLYSSPHGHLPPNPPRPAKKLRD